MIDDLINQYFPEFNLIPNRIYKSIEDGVYFVYPSIGPLESLLLCDKEYAIRSCIELKISLTYPIYTVHFVDENKLISVNFRWHYNRKPDLSSIVPTEFGILIPPGMETLTASWNTIIIIRLVD